MSIVTAIEAYAAEFHALPPDRRTLVESGLLLPSTPAYTFRYAAGTSTANVSIERVVFGEAC